MVEAGNPQDVHAQSASGWRRARAGPRPSHPGGHTLARSLRARSENGVDERAKLRGRGQRNEQSDEEQAQDDRDQEPGATLNEELEQLADRPDETQGHAPAPDMVRRGRSIQKPHSGRTTAAVANRPPLVAG